MCYYNNLYSSPHFGTRATPPRDHQVKREQLCLSWGTCFMIEGGYKICNNATFYTLGQNIAGSAYFDSRPEHPPTHLQTGGAVWAHSTRKTSATTFQDSFLVGARISGSGGTRGVHPRHALRLYQGVGVVPGNGILPLSHVYEDA